jgi:hypothetical protein
MTVDTSPAVEHRLTTVVGETFNGDVDWTLSETDSGYRIALADRVLDLDQRDGPTESTHWIITLRVDGETVSKFGPYGSTEDCLSQLDTVLTADVFYTVCCDG